MVESDAEKEAAEVLVWFLRLRAQKKQTIVTRMPDDYARRAMVWGRARQVSRQTYQSVRQRKYVTILLFLKIISSKEEC